jgi:hypothetical protein
MTILSISDKKFVNQTDEQTRFPHKYVSVITVFIQLHVYNIYPLSFYRRFCTAIFYLK